MTGILNTWAPLQNIWVIWQFAGLIPTQRYRALYLVYSILINITITAYLPVSVIIELFRMKTIESFMANLSFHIAIIVTSLKFTANFLSLDKLAEIKKYIRKLDENCKKKDHEQRLRVTIHYANRLFIILLSMFVLIILFVALGAIFSEEQQLISDMWFPYDWKASNGIFWATFAYQAVAIFSQLCRAASNAMYPPIYLMVINAHFQNLIERIQNIGQDPEVFNLDESYKELMECISQHGIVMKIFNNFQKAVSVTLALACLVTATMISISIVNIMYFCSNIMEIVGVVIFAIGVIAELLMICYYGDQFSEINNQVVTSLYSINWTNQSREFKKTLLVFMGMNQKDKVIKAGSVICINMETFQAIIKFTYSLAAFVRQMK